MTFSSILVILAISLTSSVKTSTRADEQKAAPVHRGGFLKKTNVSLIELESSLLNELSGNSATKTERIHAFEKALEPLYNALPKDGSKLSHAVVRYALHRFFAQHRGWYIRGLEPIGDAPNSSLTSLKDMQEWVPSYLHEFLEHIVHGRGLSLRELAVLAATFEDLILKEEMTWLDKAYSMLAFAKSSDINRDQLAELLETYMILYTVQDNLTLDTTDKVQKIHDFFDQTIKNWKDTKDWLHGLVTRSFPGSHLFSFNDSASLVKSVGERYGGFNDQECARLKTSLLEIESRKPGRVRLFDFYQKALHGSQWGFDEKIEYLRVLGALDESDPSTPLVIIPNYVASRPNCLLTSNFYSTCCRNECEDLMQTLEEKIRSPVTDPASIMRLVTTLPSDTVPAPRKLSEELIHRLEHVAKIHHGKVPLHGRLFAQWMHHVFPRECPFPNEAGVAIPMTPEEWVNKTGQADSKASEKEMLARVSSDSCKLLPQGMVCSGDHQPLIEPSESVDSRADLDLPWNDVEELLITRPEMMDERIPPYYRLVLFAALMPTVLFLALYVKAPRKSKDAKVTSGKGAILEKSWELK
mmetsp:Transcript_100033/g.188269  ORF Transcript_100033/g.188269 Transcript_100033/m.188269 type:complete len:583 (-) Transcript_100033:142-1890(-)